MMFEGCLTGHAGVRVAGAALGQRWCVVRGVVLLRASQAGMRRMGLPGCLPWVERGDSPAAVRARCACLCVQAIVHASRPPSLAPLLLAPRGI
jgi:hypothetical protein